MIVSYRKHSILAGRLAKNRVIIQQGSRFQWDYPKIRCFVLRENHRKLNSALPEKKLIAQGKSSISYYMNHEG
ncbi:MAG TPA: hypothetical protein DF296_06425 [Candidatus Margulisbacteria bacterium]|nr:hypothetical protein [Candidatus Margulisiibacteriota bacterium]